MYIYIYLIHVPKCSIFSHVILFLVYPGYTQFWYPHPSAIPLAEKTMAAIPCSSEAVFSSLKALRSGCTPQPVLRLEWKTGTSKNHNWIQLVIANQVWWCIVNPIVNPKVNPNWGWLRGFRVYLIPRKSTRNVSKRFHTHIIYIYIYTYTYVYIYIYIYTQFRLKIRFFSASLYTHVRFREWLGKPLLGSCGRSREHVIRLDVLVGLSRHPKKTRFNILFPNIDKRTIEMCRQCISKSSIINSYTTFFVIYFNPFYNPPKNGLFFRIVKWVIIELITLTIRVP